MATVYSANYSTGTYTYTRVRVDYSGTSATATLLYTRTNTYSGSTSATNATFTFGGQSVTFDKTFYGQQTDATVASVSFTISSSGGTYSGSTSNAGLMGFSGSVTIPAQSTAPSGLTASNLVAGPESFTADVSLSSWGSGGTSSSYYKELQCWTYDATALTYPRRYLAVTSTSLSSTITVDNYSSSTDNPPLQIKGNTQYTLGLYATNGAANTGSIRWRDAVTLAYKPYIVLESVTKNSANFVANIKADGGHYKKALFYSIDGTNWIVAATQLDGTATSVPFIVSGLDAETAYTLRTKVVTFAGETPGDDFTFYTSAKTPAFYGSDAVQRAQETGRFYASVSSQAANVKRIYGSANGQAQIVFDRSLSRTNRPELPPTSYGRVYYKATSSDTTLKSVELQNVAEFESLCAATSSAYTWTATVGATPVVLSSRSTNCIVGIDIGTEITSIPNYFLYGCSYYKGDLIVPDNVTSIGTYFAGRCGNSSNKLNVVNLGKNVTSIGTYCLTLSYFEPESSTVILPGEITSIPNNFMYNAYQFNNPIHIPNKVTSIGTYFLSGITIFNSEIIFNSVLISIGAYFLRSCTNFNKNLMLPPTLTSIGTYFLYQCDSMVSIVNVGSLAATVASSSNYSLSTNSSSAAMYTTGITIAGSTRANWISRFANRTSSPYRKLIDAGY